MTQPLSDIEAPYRAAYYDPPRVRWFLLSAGIGSISLATSLFAGGNYGDDAICILDIAWAIYFCIWIRRIVPNSKSLSWLLVSIAIGLVSIILNSNTKSSSMLISAADWFGTAALVLYFVCIFVIRAELVRHYNQREDFTLVLGPIMTLFFSFAYFQYHLYDIAEQRLKERSAFVAM